MTGGMGHMKHRIGAQTAALALAVGLGCGGPALAKIEFHPQLEVRESWSDGVSSENGFITTISPGADISFNSRRVTGGITYNYERRIGIGTRVVDKNRHNLVARANANIIEDFLSLDTGAVATRLIRDLRGPLSLNPEQDGQNLSDVFNVFVRPTVSRPLGNLARFTASYEFAYTDINDITDPFAAGGAGFDGDLSLGAVADSKSHGVNVSLASLPSSSNLTWTLSGRYARENIKVLSEQTEIYSGNFDLEYALTRKISLLGSAGWESTFDDRDTPLTDQQGQPVFDNNGDFIVDPSAGRTVVFDQQGVTWDVGLRLNPNQRTNLVVRGGRRFGDLIWSVALNYQPRPGLTLVGSYNQSVDTFGRLLTQNVNGIPETFIVSRNRVSGLFLGGIFPVPGLINGFPTASFSAVNNSVFRLRSGSLGVTYDRRKFTGNLSLFFQTRDLLSFVPLPGVPDALEPTNIGDRDRSVGAFLTNSYKIGRKSSVSLDLFYSALRFQLSEGRNDNFYGGSVSYTYSLGRYVNLFSRVYGSQRTSNFNTGFDNNDFSVSVGATARF